MCFTKRFAREQKRPKVGSSKVSSSKVSSSKVASSKVSPLPVPLSFTVEEVIQCWGCFDHFRLQDIKINCSGCSKFFHCKVAGTCHGSKCMDTLRDGTLHRKVWCIRCVDNSPMNDAKESRDEQCICNECKKK